MKHFFKTLYLTFREKIFHLCLFFLSKSVNPPQAHQIKKILIIRLDRIGDLVLSTAFLKSLRKIYPQAHITLLGSLMSKELLNEASFLDDVLIYEKGMDLRRQGYDMVFDLMKDYTLTTALLTYQTKAPYRVGFDVYGRGVFFNICVKPEGTQKHFVEETLDVLRSVQREVKGQPLELPLTEKSFKNVDQFLCDHFIGRDEKFLCIHPGGHYQTQRWLPERFAKVADRVIQKFDCKVVFLGADQDKNLMHDIEMLMKEKAIYFIGAPLNQWVSMLSRAHMLVCNNSGMLHMACAVKTPTISMMGPSEYPRWLPYGEGHVVIRKDIKCIGCNSGVCKIKTMECMTLISVDEVVEAVVGKF